MIPSSGHITWYVDLMTGKHFTNCKYICSFLQEPFHILQIYLFLCTGTIPWAATVNSAYRASQGGGFFLQKGRDNHFQWIICLNNSCCEWPGMFNVSRFLPDTCKPKNESSCCWLTKLRKGIRSLSSRCAGTRAGSTWTPMPRLVDVFLSTVTTITTLLKDFC